MKGNNKFTFQLVTFLVIIIATMACKKKDQEELDGGMIYTMPSEEEIHEGTWLFWPHQFQFGVTYRNRLDETWVAMTKTLVSSENVHIVAYNTVEKERIIQLLETAHVNTNRVDFKIYKTDDVWARDSGPIYVKDQNGTYCIEDWGFNGWGKKFNSKNCDKTPSLIGADQGFKVLNLNDRMILEGGAVEIDGNGTLMATKSCIFHKKRNPEMSIEKAETLLKKYYGVTNFIWLEGVAGLEITDMHIDGFAKFVKKNTLLTMSVEDLLNWDVPQADIDLLYASKNKNGAAYNIVKLPLTQSNVVTTYGKNLGYKGSYVNFYVANNKVLVPNYNDPNDAIANSIIQNLFPNRTVVGIDVRNLYANGGMVHCVTQQQPQ